MGNHSRQQGVPLTARERQILEGLIRGESAPGIANRLSLSAHTVRHHVKNLHVKFGVSSRAELVVAAIKAGIG